MDRRRRGTKTGLSHSTLFIRPRRAPLVVIPDFSGEDRGTVVITGSFGIYTFVNMVEDKLVWERELKKLQDHIQKTIKPIVPPMKSMSAEVELERFVDGELVKSPLIFLHLLEDNKKNFSLGIAVIPFEKAHQNDLVSSDEEEILFTRALANTHAELAMREEEDVQLDLSDEVRTVLTQAKLTFLARRGRQGLYNPSSIRTKILKTMEKYAIEEE